MVRRRDGRIGDSGPEDDPELQRGRTLGRITRRWPGGLVGLTIALLVLGGVSLALR